MPEPNYSPVPDTRGLAAEHERLGRAVTEIVADYARALDRAAASARDRGLRSSAATGDLVAYASGQCHYSFIKGVDILGMGRDNLRKIGTDESFHIRPDLLREAIRRVIS